MKKQFHAYFILFKLIFVIKTYKKCIFIQELILFTYWYHDIIRRDIIKASLPISFCKFHSYHHNNISHKYIQHASQILFVVSDLEFKCDL